MRALLAVLIFLVAATPAAAQWSEPVNVSSAHEFADDPTLGFGGDGRGPARGLARGGVGAPPPAGTFAAPLGSPERLVSRTAVIPAPVFYGSTRTAAARLSGNRLSIV